MGRTTKSPDTGFTLVELLLVVALVAVLGGLALQAVVAYRKDAYDARAMHDVGNAAVAQESYYATYFTYVNFTATGPATLSVPGLVVSESVTLKGVGDEQKFTVEASSSKGTGKKFVYDSETDTIRSD
ncbi:MAG: hypothetical protein KatS3mg076_2469 [Candidatus Binatia bacterium]|nr:MAG: hypothetical protein KatS3mg076_2469 [Candidatus Binatia bacterium]